MPTQDEHFSWLLDMFSTMQGCVIDVDMDAVFRTHPKDLPLNVWSNVGKIFVLKSIRTRSLKIKSWRATPVFFPV